MRLINNTSTNRVIDVLGQTIREGVSLDIASPALSLFAFIELRDLLNHAGHSRIILSLDSDGDLTLLGSPADRVARNRLQGRWLARECAKWIRERSEVRASATSVPQSAYFFRHSDMAKSRVITGNCPFSTDGLGLAPGNQLSLIQCTETPEEAMLFGRIGRRRISSTYCSSSSVSTFAFPSSKGPLPEKPSKASARTRSWSVSPLKSFETKSSPWPSKSLSGTGSLPRRAKAPRSSVTTPLPTTRPGPISPLYSSSTD